MRCAFLTAAAVLLAGCMGPLTPDPSGADDLTPLGGYRTYVLLDEPLRIVADEDHGRAIDVPGPTHGLHVEWSVDAGVLRDARVDGLGSCTAPRTASWNGWLLPQTEPHVSRCADWLSGPQRVSWAASGPVEGRIRIVAYAGYGAI